MSDEISAKIEEQGQKIRDLKTSKADESIVKAEVAVLLALKTEYKSITGKDYVTPKPDESKSSEKSKGSNSAPNAENAAKKAAKKDEKALKKAAYKTSEVGVTDSSVSIQNVEIPNSLNTNPVVQIPLSVNPSSIIRSFTYFPSQNEILNRKCQLLANALNIQLVVRDSPPPAYIPYLPAIILETSSFVPSFIFSSNAICRYFLSQQSSSTTTTSLLDSTFESILDIEEFILQPGLAALQQAEIAGVHFPLDDAPYKGTEFVQYDSWSTVMEVYCLLNTTTANGNNRGSSPSSPSPSLSPSPSYTSDLSPDQLVAYESILNAVQGLLQRPGNHNDNNKNNKVQLSSEILKKTPFLGIILSPILEQLKKYIRIAL